MIYLPFQSRGWHLSKAMRLVLTQYKKKMRHICHSCCNCNSGHKNALSLTKKKKTKERKRTIQFLHPMQKINPISKVALLLLSLCVPG